MLMIQFFEYDFFIELLCKMFVDCYLIWDCDLSNQDIKSQISVKKVAMMEIHTKSVETDEDKPECKKLQTEELYWQVNQ